MSEFAFGMLSEIAKGKRGVTYKPEDLVLGGEQEHYRLLTAGNIQDGITTTHSYAKVTPRCVSQNQLISPNEILVCMSNGSKRLVGKSSRLRSADSKQYCVGAFCSTFTPSENADPEFVFQVFQSEIFKKHVSDALEGSAINNLKNSTIESFEVPIPPLPEQKKIAEILSGIDRAISRASALLQKEKLAFHAVLNEQIVNIDDRHHKKAGDMLEENILTAMKDGNHGEQYPKKSEFMKTGIPYLSASSISDDGDIDLASCPCLSLERSRLMRIPPAEGGDVILTHNASIGKVAIIPKNVDIMIASTSTTYYRTNEDLLGREFLAVTMKSDFYQNQLKRIMGQTTRNQVPITAQRELLLITPPRDIQERISQIYTSYKSIRLGRVAQLEGLQFLKSSLASDLLSGRKRVSI